MSLLPTLAVFVAALLGSIAQLLLKTVAGAGLRGTFRDGRFWMAVGLYGLSAVIFVVSLRYSRLLILYPVIASSYIWTSLLAARYLGERMGPLRWTGIGLVIGGIVLTQL